MKRLAMAVAAAGLIACMPGQSSADEGSVHSQTPITQAVYRAADNTTQATEVNYRPRRAYRSYYPRYGYSYGYYPRYNYYPRYSYYPRYNYYPRYGYGYQYGYPYSYRSGYRYGYRPGISFGFSF